ncbi:hypothetical protein [uncultured Devosia sp.]|uniref:hypothetical protein n=1 Tax=uncultured Devosia sp. TaxID=211434 RepID=UPI0035CC7102
MQQADRLYPEGATEKFLELEHDLHCQFPDAKSDAAKLASEVLDPKVATADALWPIIWNKPIHAGNNETGANNTVARLRQHFDGHWREIFREEGDYSITHQGSKNANISFTANGRIARDLLNADDNGQVVKDVRGQIGRSRYYAIVSAAEWLRRRELLDEYPVRDFADADLRVLVPKLEDELGIRWRHITVLHLLTDLGIACKPDIHLTTTARVLGFTNITAREPKRDEALQIVEMTKALTNRLGDGYTLRYVDKTMFQISKLLFRTPEPVRERKTRANKLNEVAK